MGFDCRRQDFLTAKRDESYKCGGVLMIAIPTPVIRWAMSAASRRKRPEDRA